MKLSIITVTYNDADGLHRTYQSLKSIPQSINWQWILVDSSPEKTKEMIPIFEKELQSFVYKTPPPEGIYSAMNLGVAAAEGDFSLFLNSGDELVSGEHLFEILRDIEKKKSDVYVASVEIARNKKVYKTQVPSNSILWELLGVNHVCHQGVIYSKRATSLVYSEKFRLIADYEHLLNCYNSGMSFERSSITISRFQRGGVSDSVFSVIGECFALHWKNLVRNPSVMGVFHLMFWLVYAFYIPLRKVGSRIWRGKELA